MIPVERIQEIWELFIHAESGTKEKSAWLDVLLAIVLLEKSEGRGTNDIFSFCLPGDVFTLIGCELFADVHQICSFAGDGEDLSPLQNYLLKGRGWRSLVILDDLGVKGLSCSEELANLIISLYPVCLRYKWSSSTNLFLFSKGLRKPGNNSPLKFHSKQKCRPAVSTKSEAVGFSGGSIIKQAKGQSPIQASPIECSASSESEFLEEEISHNKTSILKIRLDPMDFDYFTSIIRSEDESRFDKFHSDSKQYLRKLGSEKEKKSPNDFISGKVKAVLESEVSVLEFCELSMKLLQTLCDTDEESQANSNAKIAVQVLGFVLENLCALQYGSEVSLSAPLAENDVAHLKTEMSWLLHSSLVKVLRCPEITCTIVEHKTLSSILGLLEDALKKYTFGGKNESCANQKLINDVFLDEGKHPEYIYGLLHCVFVFLHSLLDMHKPGDVGFELFLEMFWIFEKSLSGSLIEIFITSLSSEPEISATEGNCLSSTAGFQVLDLVGSLISKVKDIRVEVALKDGVIGTNSKRRPARSRRHSLSRRANLNHLLHHHKTDAFGIPGILFKSEKELAPCTVSILFGKLVDLINNYSISMELRTHAVQVATKCGTCCCFPSSKLLDAVASALVNGVTKSVGNNTYQTSCFLLLERTLYPQLWGCMPPLNSVSVFSTYLCCLNLTVANYRSFLPPEKLNQKKTWHACQGSTISSNDFQLGLDSSKQMHDIDSDDSHSQWTKLMFYRDLIESQDFRLCHSTLSHLLRILTIATPKVISELLELVIFPSFISAKAQYLCSRCDIAKFKILSSLSIFSCYLGRCPEFTSVFFDSDCGLLHIIDLIFLPEFSQACCYVLEEIILVGMSRIQQYPMPSNTSCLHIKKMHSNSLLLNCIKFFSDRVVLYLEQYFVSDALNDSVSTIISTQVKEYMSIGNHSDYLNVGEDISDERSDVSFKSFYSAFLKKIEIVNTDTFEKALKFAFMFWKACAVLVLKSKVYRDIFSSAVVCKKGFLFLQMLVLHAVGRCHVADDIFSTNWCIKSIETLLIIYLKCPPVGPDINKLVGEAGVVEKLRSLVLNLRTQPNIKICLLCEVFIRCATDDSKGKPALLLARKPELPSLKLHVEGSCSGDVEAVRDEVDDEDDGCSITYGEAYVTADEGYDGDIEILDVDEAPFTWKGYLHSHSDSCMASLPNSSLVNMVNQGLPGRKWRIQNIAYPELCCLALDLLVHLHNLLRKQITTSSTTGDTNSEGMQGSFPKVGSKEGTDSTIQDQESYLEIIIQSLQRITALCRDNSSNCILLCKQGAITRLLQGFSSCLQNSDPKLLGIQQVVLDLFNYLAQHSITAKELSLYLEYFKGNDPPVESLIIPLSQLMMNTKPQPYFIMCFPVESDSKLGKVGQDWMLDQEKNKPFNIRYQKHDTTNNVNNAAVTLTKKLHDEHTQLDIPSVWALSALALPVDADIGWSPWTHGFSLSMWLQLGCVDQKHSKSCCSTPPPSTPTSSHHLSLTSLSGSHSDWGIIPEYPKESSPCPSINLLNDNCQLPVTDLSSLHLFSIGNEMLTLEAWTNPTIDSLTLKLIRTDGKKIECLSESTVENCLSPQHWHHLAVNVKDFMQRRKSVIEVTLFIDGCKDVKVLMAFNGLLVRRATPTCLLLGHSASQSTNFTTSWYFGNLALFRCPVFSKEKALYLMSMGPNFTHLTDCDVEKQHPNFSSTINSAAVVAGIDWDAVFEVKNGNLKLLQDNLLLTYSAQNSTFVNVYPVVVTNPGGVVGSLFPGQPGFRVVTMDQRASQQLPLSLQPVFLAGSPNLQMYQGVAAAVSSLGGTTAFLFLFAQVVQMSASEDCQARALSLLLKLVHNDGDMFSQFVNEDSHKLLIKVLTSSLCKSGSYILKALLDASCDKSVLQYQSATGTFHVVSQSNAIITQPALLLTIIHAWRGWEKLKPPCANSYSAKDKDEISKVDSSRNLEYIDEGGILGIFLCVILTLLRDDHPFREFNAAQLNRVGAVEALLMFCKERFMLDDSPCDLHASVCCSLVEVIRSLMGAPPEFSHIVALSDFLVLVHRASATYVTHARSSFYFLPSPNPPSLSSSNLTIGGSPASKTQSHIPRTTPIAPINPDFHKLNHELKTGTSTMPSKNGKDSLLAQPVDPLKLNKALTNLQIKQGGEEIGVCPKTAPAIDIQHSNKVIDYYGMDSNSVVDSNKVTVSEAVESQTIENQDLISDEKWEKDYGDLKEKERFEKDYPSIVSDKLVNLKQECSANLKESLSSGKKYVSKPENSCRAKNENRIYVKLNNEKVLKSSHTGDESDEAVADVSIPVDEDGISLDRVTADGHRKVDSTEKGVGGVADWVENEGPSQPLVVEGLLLLLRDTLLVLPDSMSHQVLNYIVRAEVLLVMANHYDSRVRTAVVKVIAAFLQRAGDEEANRFLKARGFHLLANQLGQFVATTDLVEACLSLVTRCSASLEEQVSLSSILSFPLPLGGGGEIGLGCLQAAAFPPLLALLPKSIQDVALSHNLMLFLREVYTKVPQTSRPLLDSGLLEALTKTLVALAHQPLQCRSSTDNTGSSMNRDLLLADIHLFLVAIVSHSVSTAGAHHMQVINDVQHLLNFMESLEKGSCGFKSNCVRIIREAQVAVLNGAIETVQSRMTSTLLQQQMGSKRSASSITSSVLSTSYDDSNQPDSQISASISSLSSGIDRTSSPYITSFINPAYSRPLEIPQNEVNERFKVLLQKSVDFLVSAEPHEGCYEVCKSEINFSRFIMSVIIRGLATVLEKNLKGKTRIAYTDHRTRYGFQQRNSLGGDGSLWNIFVWAARDLIRIQAGRLLVFLLCPWQPLDQRTCILHTLSEEPYCREILTAILQTHPQVEHRFAVFFQDLLHSHHSSLSGVGEIKLCEELAEKMESWGLLTSPLCMPSPSCFPEVRYSVSSSQPMEHPLWNEEVSLLQEELERQRQSWVKQNESAQLRSVYKHEALAKNVTECALDITRTVVDAQNLERKTFMEHIKLAYSVEVQVKVKWQKIIQQFTHERAVWFFSNSYPRSWQLDSTEGPIRLRKRLQRCHLGIEKKYLMSNFQNKLETFTSPVPLSYLFHQERKSCWPHTSSTASVLIERLLTDEKIRHTCAACIVSPALEVPGELLIGECSLYFVADDSISEKDMWEVASGGCGLDGSSMAWPLEDVIGVYNRRFQLQERALEIFLVNGKTYLIAFHTLEERETFVFELSRCQLPNQLLSDNLNDVVQMWREGLITNFEYLTQLNKMAGRSFNDLMQYPVFPFILSDYTSQTLDIMDSKVFRNLKKPMAVQEKKNELHYVSTYNVSSMIRKYLKEELQDVFNSISLNQEPYHYGSHYSNSGTVLHFLVRLPPFTQMFLAYQDQNFDIPDRTFHSLQTTWRLTSTDSTTDVKELIPEFFFLPEFLINSEGFNFGVRQSGERVHNVHLPPWCEGDARKFILIHRQALESDYVRENIHHWIDLVFGYKQTGRAAVEAINVFHPATYYGFDVESIRDPLERVAWETMIKTYGQTPRQLFRSAHPMVVQTLLSRVSSVSVPSVLPYVRGLQWGSYVGSPADPPPRVVWHHQHHTTVATLVPLLTNDVFGLAPSTSILLSYGKSKSPSMVCTTCVLGVALVTWGHSDGIVRVKLRKEQPPWPIIRSSNLDPIWICGSMPDCCQLWVGHSSGKLVIYRYNFSPMKGQLDFKRPSVTLVGHTGGILSLYICRTFSIAVTASQDGSAIIWDLNNLTYVRSIPNFGSPVKLVCVSETLGDVVTVSDVMDESSISLSSCIRLYTINAQLIGSVVVGSGPLEVTSICISTAPEGISVNAVAAGLANGTIRLWSTWDLALIREITCELLTKPIISIAYSHDSQHLYASSSDGSVVIWEAAGSKGVSKTPKFLNLTSL